MAGPSEDGALGVVVFPHDSATQAEERMREDPAVAAGVFACEVQAWRMSLFGTGSTRDWFGFTQVIHIRTDAVNAWRMLATCDGLERWFLGMADAWTHDGRQWPREVSLEHGAKLRMTWMCVGACDERGAFSTEEQSEDNDVRRVWPDGQPMPRVRTGSKVCGDAHVSRVAMLAAVQFGRVLVCLGIWHALHFQHSVSKDQKSD